MKKALPLLLCMLSILVSCNNSNSSTNHSSTTFETSSQSSTSSTNQTSSTEKTTTNTSSSADSNSYEHIHSFSIDFKYDNYYHWKECICGEKNNYEIHSYDSDYDEECNVCGYKRDLSLIVLEFTLSNTNDSYSVKLNKDYSETITDIVIPKEYDSLPINKIDDFAFFNSKNLKSIMLPETIRTIGSNAFNSCISLTTINIPNNVNSIGEMAFFECTSLSNINIPSSVNEIGLDAFYNSSGLIEVNETNTNYSSDTQGNLYNKNKTELIHVNKKITKIVIPNTVTKISTHAFYNCQFLSSIYINETINEISPTAFIKCPALINVDNSNTNYFSDKQGVLYNKVLKEIVHVPTKSTSITIAETITHIGINSFNGCTQLTEVIIPKTITSINMDAFYGCSSLNNLTFLGNKTEWENIDLIDDWNNNSAIETITCTDGVLTID